MYRVGIAEPQIEQLKQQIHAALNALKKTYNLLAKH